MNKCIVIPGNYNQGLDWAEKNCKKRWNSGDTSASLSEYIIITDVKQLFGIQNPRGVFVGSWRERNDIHDIVMQLQLCCSGENPRLTKVWESL